MIITTVGLWWWLLIWFMKLQLLIIVSLSLIIIGWIGLSTFIGYQVHTVCIAATKYYSGDCTEALVKVVDETSFEYRFRNDAVWAIGQLGDRQALPMLQRYHTGVVPSKENYDQTLSQYELQKAIFLVTKGQNITAMWWRTNKN